jgi:hypothetical protein
MTCTTLDRECALAMYNSSGHRNSRVCDLICKCAEVIVASLDPSDSCANEQTLSQACIPAKRTRKSPNTQIRKSADGGLHTLCDLLICAVACLWSLMMVRLPFRGDIARKAGSRPTGSTFANTSGDNCLDSGISANTQVCKSASLHVGKPACMQAISLRSTPATMIGRQ